MSRWMESGRARWWLMQGMLCLVLVGMVGVAELVRQGLLRARRPELLAAEQLGGFEVRRPKRWALRQWGEGIVMEEPGGGGVGGRRIEVWAVKVAGHVSPLEYLVRSGEVHLQSAAALLADQDKAHGAMKRVIIARWPGVMFSATRVVQGVGTPQAFQRRQVMGCAMLPRGEAVVMRMESDGMGDVDDEELLARVGASLSVVGQAQAKSGGDWELEQNVWLSMPGELAGATGATGEAEQDRLRVSRCFVEREGPGWLGVDVAPCLALDGEPADELRAMMMLRDPGFGVGGVEQVDENTWRCFRRSKDLFEGCSYLRVNNDGRAVLAEFRWLGAAEERVEELWEKIAGGLSFEESGEVEEMLARGTKAARGLPADMGEVVGAAEVQEKWQWYDEWRPRTAGMSVQYGVNEADVWGMQLTEGGPPPGTANRQMSHWRMGRDGGAYDFFVTHVGPGIGMAQETHVSQGQMRMVVRRMGSEGVQSVGGRPEGFVAGGILSLVLGRMEFRPMVLRTDWVPDPHGLGSPLPLALVLEPAFDLPKREAGKEQAMACWSVRVSGSSWSGRWYMDGNGRVQSMAFGQGVHLHRVEDDGQGGPATRAIDADADK